MKNVIVNFSRRFQVWSYTVGHGQLLLRSTKDAQNSTQVDVLFKNVGLVSLPTFFDGLTVIESTKQELESSGLTTGLLPAENRKCMKLEGNNWRGAIVAGNIAWSEDDAEHYAESKLIS
jgi:hypothetical protein